MQMLQLLLIAGVVLRPVPIDEPILDVRVVDVDADGSEDVVAVTEKSLLLLRSAKLPVVRRAAPPLTVVGKGLLLGIQLDRPCAELVATALEQGLLINVTANTVVRLLPPLVTSEQQADLLVSKLSSLLREFLARN